MLLVPCTLSFAVVALLTVTSAVSVARVTVGYCLSVVAATSYVIAAKRTVPTAVRAARTGNVSACHLVRGEPMLPKIESIVFRCRTCDKAGNEIETPLSLLVVPCKRVADDA